MTASLRKAAATARATKSGRVAVIDIGSNSLRLVVFDKRSRCPVPVFNEKAQPGLGKGLERNGLLNPDGTEAALVNIRRFVNMAEAMGVDSIALLATAAVRDAKDGISKRGDVYLRTLLVQGARSALQSALRATPGRASHLQRWIVALYGRTGYHKTLVAIANKHARMLWAMLARDEPLDVLAWRRHARAQPAGAVAG